MSADMETSTIRTAFHEIDEQLLKIDFGVSCSRPMLYLQAPTRPGVDTYGGESEERRSCNW